MQPADAGAAVAGGMVLLVVFFYVFACMFAVAAFVFWIWMIVDVVTKEPPGNDKIVWVLIVVLLHWIGALIYYFVRKRPRGRAGITRVA